MAPVGEVTTLGAQLSEKAAEMGKMMPEEVMKSMGAANAELASRYKPTGVAVGATAPSFTLQNATGASVTLGQLLSENKAVVLTWYRGGWCPFCNLALQAMTEANGELASLGARLVTLTPETPNESLTTAEKLDLPFEVLSDVGSKVAQAYGVAFEVGGPITELYKGMGVDLTTTNGNTPGGKPMLPVPATFVLDKSGKVVYSFVDLDYTKRAEPADVVAAVKALQ